MPVGSEELVVGSYVVTFDGASVGIFQGDPGSLPAITRTPHSRPITPTDRYGGSKIDSIRLGYDYMFEGVLMEYPKGLPILQAMENWGLLGLIGGLKYLAAKALVLTAVAGTTAATAPASITASKAVPADNHPVRLIYGPELRVVPVRLDLLPYLNVATPVCLTQT